MGDEGVLGPEDFILKSSPKAKEAAPSTLNLEELEKIAIEQAIEKHEGNMSMVAKELGLGRTTLYRKMAKYGI